MFALLLIVAAAVSIGQAIRANREAAVSEAVNGFFLQNDLLAQASAAMQSGTSAKSDPDLKVRTAAPPENLEVTESRWLILPS
jgi:eukaryotic-like serine/threonine-protein kinase